MTVATTSAAPLAAMDFGSYLMAPKEFPMLDVTADRFPD